MCKLNTGMINQFHWVRWWGQWLTPVLAVQIFTSMLAAAGVSGEGRVSGERWVRGVMAALWEVTRRFEHGSSCATSDAHILKLHHSDLATEKRPICAFLLNQTWRPRFRCNTSNQTAKTGYHGQTTKHVPKVAFRRWWCLLDHTSLSRAYALQGNEGYSCFAIDWFCSISITENLANEWEWGQKQSFRLCLHSMSTIYASDKERKRSSLPSPYLPHTKF